MNGQTERKNKSGIVKKQDLILILVILLAAAAAGGYYWYTHRTPACRAEVRVSGQLVCMLDLTKDQEVVIEGANGGSNRLKTENGAVWCEEATCPDKVCIHQGRQSLDGSLIVCLPNEMIVTVITGESS